MLTQTNRKINAMKQRTIHRTTHCITPAQHARVLRPASLLLLLLSMLGANIQAADVDSVLTVGAKKTAAAQASQRRIDATAEKTDRLLREFQLANKQIDGLQIYNTQLSHQIEDQHRTMAEMTQSIENAALIERQIIPLSLNMLDALQQLINLDLPFNLEERQASIAQVRENMRASRFSAAEKSRQVLELYSIESEYSSTIHQEAGILTVEGHEYQGAFLRIGRIALLFQSNDQRITKVWDKVARRWHTAPSGEYRTAITEAIRMAKKQAPLDMIKLPISPPISPPTNPSISPPQSARAQNTKAPS